jgi:hypothetical protein
MQMVGVKLVDRKPSYHRDLREAPVLLLHDAGNFGMQRRPHARRHGR